MVKASAILPWSFFRRLEQSAEHLKCFSCTPGYVLIIQLFSLQGITHLCQPFLSCSMNSSNYTNSPNSYYPKQSQKKKKKKSCLLIAVVGYCCRDKLPQRQRLEQHRWMILGSGPGVRIQPVSQPGKRPAVRQAACLLGALGRVRFLLIQALDDSSIGCRTEVLLPRGLP